MTGRAGLIGCIPLALIGVIGVVACSTAKSDQNPSYAPLRIDVNLSAHISEDSATLASSRFSTKASDELLLAFIAVSGARGRQSISSVDGAGLSWSRVVHANAQSGTAEIWRAVATGKVNSASIAASPSQPGARGSVTVVSFIAADTALGAIAGMSAAIGAPRVALSGTRAGSIAWATGVASGAATARILGSAQASADQFVDVAGRGTYWTQYRSASGTALTLDDRAPSSPWNLAAVEVRPAVPGLGNVVAQTANCVAVPHLCGFPDGTNTGVPAGTRLKRSGSITVRTPGAIVDGRDVRGSITVLADDVTIRNSRITSGAFYPIHYGAEGYAGLVVEDTEIIGTSSDVTSGIAFGGYTALRVNVHGTSDGLKVESGTVVKDSFLHDLAIGSDTHNDGMQSTGGRGIAVVHNTVLAPKGAVSCLMFGGENGAPSDILIDDNLLDGGNYTIYLDPHGEDRTIVNNRFGRDAVYGTAKMNGSYSAGGNLSDATAQPVALQ
jgi:hypothetical protein